MTELDSLIEQVRELTEKSAAIADGAELLNRVTGEGRGQSVVTPAPTAKRGRPPTSAPVKRLRQLLSRPDYRLTAVMHKPGDKDCWLAGSVIRVELPNGELQSFALGSDLTVFPLPEPSNASE